jgi:Tol biopolymer transport system component
MKTKSVHLLTSLGLALTLLLFAGGNVGQSFAPAIQAATSQPTAPTENPSGPGTQGPNSDKITICHVPPGNPANAHTITISRSAWRVDGKGQGGHGPGLHGGDYEGPCRTGTAPATAAGTAAATTAPVVGPATCVGWIFYHSNRTGNLNIFRLDVTSGTVSANVNVSQGTGRGVEDISPARSPDSTFAAFSSNRDGHWEIYIGAADGSSRWRVTNTRADNVSPMWSPDGKSLVYESTRNGAPDIYMAALPALQETQLTDDKADDANPFWSPDSQKILFQTNRDGLWQIYELTLGSKALKRLSDGKSNDINPQYSPDGTQIVFRSYPKGARNTVIYTMGADGSNRQPISDPKGNALNPAWSPDNTLIAYQSNLKGAGDIFVYQVSTKQTRQVTDNTTRNSAPTWNCDGSAIVYTSVVSGKPQINQTSALPIDAKPIKPADATQLTGDNASNQNPENSPAVEDASHRAQAGSPK